MPSIDDSRRHVTESLDAQAAEVDHEAILAGLQDEIDRHNAVKDDLRASMRQRRRPPSEEPSQTPMRFRFKSGQGDPRKRKNRSRPNTNDHDRHHRKHRRREHYATPPEDLQAHDSPHPFPREPTDPLAPSQDPEDAFRTSLLDALADDEGAAYWESVYSQPIHIYPRPSLQTDKGELEQMNDEEYVDYVKTKMWERKNPEMVQERKRREKERKLEEEERTRRREEFVRRRERAAWERSQRWRARDDGDGEDGGNRNGKGKGRDEYEFAGETNSAPSHSEQAEREYAKAWTDYLSAWDALKYDLLTEPRNDTNQPTPMEPSKRIPWPVLPSRPVIKPNIEAFMQHAPSDSQRSTVQILKAERVRWHPDKMQQRFRGAVDGGTLTLVTAVFQVVDGVLEEARKREGGG